MQIFIIGLLLLLSIFFVIYKLNNKFEKNELIIFVATIVILIIGWEYYEKSQKDFFPNSFKAHYKKLNNIDIDKLSSEMLNNKKKKKKNKFIYNFTYIVNKEGKEYICKANSVKIIKVQDEYVFNSFEEDCKKIN